MSTNLLFFGIYPYVALLICLVGSWARFDLSQYTWKAGSSQMLSKKGMRVYSNLFHVGVLFILAGHFVGLLTPASVYHHLISTENKQLLAMVSGGFFGVLCFIGLSGLILRRLTDARVRATGNASDLMILLVLYAQLILGLSTIVASTHHGWLGDGDARRLGPGHRHPASAGGGRSHRAGGPGLQAARRPGPDPVRAVPLHPPGAHRQRAGVVPGPALPDRASKRPA